MKVLIFTVAILGVVLADKCKPKYHYWRPYNGTIPSDAFLAGVDEDLTRNYVAKIIPLDQYLWTTPAQLKEGESHIDFAWHGYKNLMRVDEFIEILCVENPLDLSWQMVKLYASELVPRCCLVEGGIALYSNHIYRLYIGKGANNGVNYIGRAYLEQEWNGVHVMDGSNSTKILGDFAVLTYDCKINEIEVA